ncbi:MAG: hypothetical protein OXI26_00035 [bacterium]|nr:hypothetical protein [bacterium]
MLSGKCRRDETGSGTAIGMAIMFVPLMLVIVSLSMLTGSARIEQALQSTANRLARSAALCCHYTDSAEAVVHAGLAAESAAASNRIHCNNDVVADSTTIFTDVEGNDVPIISDPLLSDQRAPVPPGGSVHVIVTCRVPPEVLGGVGLPGVNVSRTAVGTASIDPFRARSGG